MDDPHSQNATRPTFSEVLLDDATGLPWTEYMQIEHAVDWIC